MTLPTDRFNEIYREIDEQMIQVKSQLVDKSLNPFVVRRQLLLLERQVSPWVTVRAASYDPHKFVAADCKIWRGRTKGDGLEGKPDVDSREESLTSIDWSRVNFSTFVQGKGDRHIDLLKQEKGIRLGLHASNMLWEDFQEFKENSILELLYRVKKVNNLHFTGTIFCFENKRHVIHFFRGCHDTQSWQRNFQGLGLTFEPTDYAPTTAKAA